MANRKKLNPDESPRAAFGVRLRTLREGRGWTQEDLSDRMGYSATHISGVEIGRRTPTPKFTASADKALGTGESLARQGEAVLNPAILDGFPQFVVQEGRAVEIRLFELGAVPGLFQSSSYAAAIVGGATQRGAITEQQATERLGSVRRITGGARGVSLRR
ncbi:Scr1 family TA system antitoxin-like transcriptional regulator [Streptomyces albidoflavus]|uniref:HTH cro/C1-type domain-containing protein n=1 Tax=Streptomyces albidoflavus TaxID=1886 RepID=A0AA37BXM4_9ACTN|nr:Scr1 family TA system antitoxin-like transcriptional regulator [Streptomyces albidoflavus]WQG72108.1 Scr1 family TA system antitoxin-like transcriptional regulator [Streptomyces albidoflavus]GHI46602.1 hypothetical protein ScoT_27760 [Streptomyces albidoflavus]